MVCQSVTIGGRTAIVCGRNLQQRSKCVGCGRPAHLLCDWKVEGGTCDKSICSGCSTNPAMHGRTDFDKDLCPEHAAAFEQWKASR